MEGKKGKKEGGETKERGKVKPHPLHCERPLTPSTTVPVRSRSSQSGRGE